MIPKLIHQTAPTAEISEKWRPYQRRLIELHPGWTYRLWTDEDNLAFVKAEYPDFVDVFTGMPKNIMRADVIRYLLMYRLGGLYLDTDYEMLKPFDLVQYDCVLPIEDEGEPGKNNLRIANSFFASAPGHPFFKAVIDALKANPPRDPGANVLTTTGPHFISAVFHRLSPSERADIFLPKRELFNPYTPRNGREYRAILKQGVAYGIHHCHGTWREYSFPQRLRNHLSTLYHKLR